MQNLITLSNGKTITNQELRDYFALVMQAEQSGEPFPVDFDYVWYLAYSTKASAKRALLNAENLFEEVDYHINNSVDMVKRFQGGGVQPEKIFLSVSCLEFFVARKVREIFEIYRECRKFVFNKLKANRMPYHIRRYVANYSQIPFGYFSILQQMTMQLIAPLDMQGYTMPDNLLPDVSEGRLFCKWLREEKEIDPNSFPDYMHQYEDGREYAARLYPLNLLSEFMEHFQNEWLKKRSEEYFKKRDASALPQITKLIGRPYQPPLISE